MTGTRPTALRTDYGGDDFTVTGATPRLRWLPAAHAPLGYELEAVIDGVPQLHRRSAAHAGTPWPWGELGSRQHVTWRVRSLAEQAEWSEPSTFETGLLDEDWTAHWVSPVEAHDPGYGCRPAHRLSAAFSLGEGLVAARLYATALGLYVPQVNDTRPGSAELLPGSTSYDQTLYAQAFDVTGLVRQGTNEIAFELSDGWYRGQVGAFRLPAQWGTRLALRAELHIDHADGSTQIIGTDETWTSTTSQTVSADLMAGQIDDPTAAAGESRPVLVDQVTGPRIDYSPAEPVRVIETLQPRRVHQVRDGVWVIDFGQNASGWVRLGDLGARGTRTVLEYGEHIAFDGDLSTSHLDSRKPGEPAIVFVQRDEVVSDGTAGAVFEPRHTVHGFRYVRLTRSAPTFGESSIALQVVHTDLRRTGSFASSDDDLNRLHRVVDWSFRGNAVDVPTDCPTRERLAWTGDYQIFAPTATRLYDVLGFSRKWLRSVRDDQLEDGRIANFSPDGRQIKHHLDDQFAMMTGSAGWGDAIVAVPWELYRAYGDEQVLEENWHAMRAWVDWALEKARTERHHARKAASPEPEPFEQYLWDGTFHWGEWTEPKERDADGVPIDPVQANPMAWFMADKGEVGTAYLFRSTSTLADIAGVIGHDDAAHRYAALADRVRDAWQRAYLRPDGRTVADTQAAYVRALSFGLIPDELRERAVGRLVELIRAAGTHLRTGFLSTGDLLPVLSDNGQSDLAYELLFRRSSPSWMAMLDRGATTVWEDWDGVDENGQAHDSLNHYSKGAVASFLHTHTLGLRQASGSVGWTDVVVAPMPGAALTWAEGTHLTPNGSVRVRWEIADETFHLSVVIPPLTTALLVAPDGSSERVGAGVHQRSTPMPVSRQLVS